MNIPENVLKYYLKNVYFVAGTGCGGKTTMSKAIAEKHDFTLFYMHMVSSKYKEIADETNQPAMTKKFPDWGAYFGRSSVEYTDWLSALGKEEVEIMLMDLIILSQYNKVIVDIHVTPETAMKFTEYGRIAFLLAEPELVVADYFERGDHKKTYDQIMALPNSEEAFVNLNGMLMLTTKRNISSVHNSGLFYLTRDENSTIEKTLALLEKHFNL